MRTSAPRFVQFFSLKCFIVVRVCVPRQQKVIIVIVTDFIIVVVRETILWCGSSIRCTYCVYEKQICHMLNASISIMAEYTQCTHIHYYNKYTVQRASKHLLYRIQTAPRQPVPTTSIGLALFLIPLMFAMHFQLSTLYPPSIHACIVYTLCVRFSIWNIISFLYIYEIIIFQSELDGWSDIRGNRFSHILPQTMRNRSEKIVPISIFFVAT